MSGFFHCYTVSITIGTIQQKYFKELVMLSLSKYEFHLSNTESFHIKLCHTFLSVN
jgi:hypothetical protein